MCFLHNMEKLCNLSAFFMEKKMVNLIARMLSMEIVYRQCGE